MHKISIEKPTINLENVKTDIKNLGVNTEKLNILKDEMHLSTKYLSKVLSIDLDSLLKHQNRENIAVSDEQLILLCRIFNIDSEYLSTPFEESENAFARSFKELNSYEKNQIAELRHFKKMLAKPQL